MAEELFDIYDEQLHPLGTATRSQTHANGYWHRSFHCWLTRREGDLRFVSFQLRQTCKDTNPGCYDITAAGHLTAGETIQEAVRELEEELGIAVDFEQLIPLGQVREDLSGVVKGAPFIDREISDVFGLVCSVPLDELRLQPEEVAGVYEADLDELIAMFEGQRVQVAATGVELSEKPGELLQAQRFVQANQFVPRDPSYYVKILRALRACT